MVPDSPSPLGSSHFGTQPRRQPLRAGMRDVMNTSLYGRGQEEADGAESAAASRYASRRFSRDMSDDDSPLPPRPIQFSAVTAALLGGEESYLADPSPSNRNHYNLSGSTAVEARKTASPMFADLQHRQCSDTPSGSRRASPANGKKRVVVLRGTPRSRLSLANSQNSSIHRENERAQSPWDLNTPPAASGASGSRPRTSFGSGAQISSRRASGVDNSNIDNDVHEQPSTIAKPYIASAMGSMTRLGGTSMRNRYRPDETAGFQGFQSIRRGLPGSFLNAAPARRGRRRQSEEDEAGEAQKEAEHEAEAQSGYEAHEQEAHEEQEQEREPEPQVEDYRSRRQQSREPENYNPPAQRDSLYERYVPSRSFARQEQPKISEPVSPSPPPPRKSSPIFADIRPSRRSTTPPVEPPQPVFHAPAPVAETRNRSDQENEAPPDFRRQKPPVSTAIHDSIEKAPVRPLITELRNARANISPARPALAKKSQNTPHRPAPPPPTAKSKVDVAELAGAKEGTRKRINHVRVNGKQFQRLEIIGRGGSSKVWRVMAENYKIYALKRVSMEDADETAVRGYKGEIDLLKKLKDNDRVVQILDWELNEEKQMLSVLMEMGELDFNRILNQKFAVNNPTFDPSFTRHYWREMLQCIQAVHAHDIVHSDLKPANFVLVQGRLKLIDFGIANAIQTDETVNVHRDTQIGTPNYMSPESLMDSSELPHNRNGPVDHGAPKIMKLGKPSDIWSLGVILYQMVYGYQPFAHISNQMSRCRAIIDWTYAIKFPANGLGDVPLPESLMRTMKACLQRDQRLRPTAEQLLSREDQWLWPREVRSDEVPMSRELLGRLMCSVVSKSKGKEVSEAEIMGTWAPAYFENARKMVMSGES